MLYLMDFEEKLNQSQGKTFNNVSRSVKALTDICEDYLVEVNKDHYTLLDYMEAFKDEVETDRGIEPIMRLHVNVDQGIDFGFTPHSLRQLCSRIKMPIRFMTNAFDLSLPNTAVEAFNSFLYRNNDSLFLRSFGLEDRTLRGVLSQRYSQLDTNVIMDVLSNTVDTDRYSIQSSYISPERFHIRFIDNEMMGIKKEDLHAGFMIDSSDVGRSALTLKSFVWKKVCSNGLIIPVVGEAYKQIHKGINPNTFQDDLVAALETMEIREAQSKELIVQNSKGTVKLEDAIPFLMRKMSIEEPAAIQLYKIAEEKYSTSPFGIVNAITEKAQEYNLSGQIDAETIAGGILAKGSLLKLVA